MKNKHWAILLGACALILSVIAFYLYNRDAGHIANIYQDSVCIASIDLDAVTEAYTLEVEDEDGHVNVISVEHGRICVSEANCPDQVCVDSGWLSTGITPSVCLPAKLTIQLEDNAATNALELDGVVG